MKLAEALSLRANAVRRIEQLRVRVVGNARFQEGEEPAEDAAALLAEIDGALAAGWADGLHCFAWLPYDLGEIGRAHV